MSGQLGADQRATIYDALASIPGVDITDEQANLDGRTGIALGRTVDNGLRHEIIVDPATGEFLGNRTVVVSRADMPNAEHLPSSAVVEWSSVTRSVAEATPSAAEFTAQYGDGQ